MTGNERPHRIGSAATISVTLLVVAGLGLPPAVFSGNAVASTVEHVVVDAKKLAQTPRGSRYVVDLTRPDAVYEFDPVAGRIDFSRVVVRTDAGEQPLQPWLERQFPKKALGRWQTGVLLLGHPGALASDPGIRPPANASARLGFTCDPSYCTCRGLEDCQDMWRSPICRRDFLGCTRRGTGEIRCICSR